MSLFGVLFGWRWQVRRLRKKWDRTREKSLKKKDPIRRIALERLDTIENSLRLLEEQHLTRKDRARLSKEVNIGIAEVKALLKTKSEAPTQTDSEAV